MQTLQMNVGGINGPVIPMAGLDPLQAYQMACVIHEAIAMLIAADCGTDGESLLTMITRLIEENEKLKETVRDYRG